MAHTALEALYAATKDSKHGFLLLIEGSRIDMASHSNDPVGHVHEVLAFNDAFHVARKFIDKVGGVLISTSDHETGGLSVGRQISPPYPEYVWYPEVLANASHSTEYLGYQIASYKGCPSVSLLIVGSDMQQFIEETIVKNGLGIHDAHEKEIDKLMSLKSNALLADYTLADMVSRRARIGVDLVFCDADFSGPRTGILLLM
jgi:alkaline phosphatase